MTRRQKTRYVAIKTVTTRALLPAEGQDLNRIEVKFVMTPQDDREQITFELTLHEAANLIEELMAAYNAIVPVLKTTRGGWGL